MKNPEALRLPNKRENTSLERFSKHFSFKVANTTEEKARVFKLRHEVYCQEIGYEPPEGTSTNIELDSHDAHSIHCLIEHKSSGLAAGCLRLVLPNPAAKSENERLPLQEYGGTSLTHPILNPARLPVSQICEISRFAIARPFRHKAINNETLTNEKSSNLFTEEERKTFPSIIVALFLSTYSLVGLSNKRHVFAMMEPRLPRLLSMSGFNFTKIGEPIEMHGKRNAFYIDHRKAEEEIHENLIPLYLHIKKELGSQFDHQAERTKQKMAAS